MKHLIPKEHHPHLRKRALLEILGFILLIAISYSQRELLLEAVDELRTSDAFYTLIMLSTYWLILPLTSYSYRLLTNKKVPVFSTSLSQLAGAGPGRIIPGGLGHISMAAVHLRKLGLKIQSAVVIPIANNFIGLIVNAFVVILAVIYHPTLIDDIANNLSTQVIFFISILIIAFITLAQWLLHARGTRKTVAKFFRRWNKLFKELFAHPNRLAKVGAIALIITLGHVLMLMLASKALGFYINPVDSLIALSVGVLMGKAIPTPGGIGAVEAGTITALIVLGYDTTQATSAALLFRVATYWQPLIPGTLAYLYLREKKLL